MHVIGLSALIWLLALAAPLRARAADTVVIGLPNQVDAIVAMADGSAYLLGRRVGGYAGISSGNRHLLVQLFPEGKPRLVVELPLDRPATIAGSLDGTALWLAAPDSISYIVDGVVRQSMSVSGEVKRIVPIGANEVVVLRETRTRATEILSVNRDGEEHLWAALDARLGSPVTDGNGGFWALVNPPLSPQYKPTSFAHFQSGHIELWGDEYVPGASNQGASPICLADLAPDGAGGFFMIGHPAESGGARCDAAATELARVGRDGQIAATVPESAALLKGIEGPKLSWDPVSRSLIVSPMNRPNELVALRLPADPSPAKLEVVPTSGVWAQARARYFPHGSFDVSSCPLRVSAGGGTVWLETDSVLAKIAADGAAIFVPEETATALREAASEELAFKVGAGASELGGAALVLGGGTWLLSRERGEAYSLVGARVLAGSLVYEGLRLLGTGLVGPFGAPDSPASQLGPFLFGTVVLGESAVTGLATWTTGEYLQRGSTDRGAALGGAMLGALAGVAAAWLIDEALHGVSQQSPALRAFAEALGASVVGLGTAGGYQLARGSLRR